MKSAPKFLKPSTAPVPADKLDALRAKVREQRDLVMEIASMEERLKERKAELQRLQSVDLPDLFLAAKVDNIGLPTEGNLPAYDAELKPYYHANIAADWDPERQGKAFAFLEGAGCSEMIKTKITIELGRGERKLALRVKAGLDKAGVPYNEGLGVPWGTLTSWLKHKVEDEGVIPPLEVIGGTVGQVVKLKERKE